MLMLAWSLNPLNPEPGILALSLNHRHLQQLRCVKTITGRDSTLSSCSMPLGSGSMVCTKG